MTERQLKYLYDIQIAGLEIEDFKKKKGNNFQVFSTDAMYRKAVERNLEIIGEAVNRLTKSGFGRSITHARSIVALRNKISHEYDSISGENLWSIVIKHLPQLLEEVSALIRDFENQAL
jgi:uncharacterized protein with HEPN domain